MAAARYDDSILANMILNRLRTSPDLDVLTFVHVAADGKLIEEVRSYRQLWENACRIAAFLDARGMEPGQRFALIMQNHPAFVETMIAASITATVFVPVDARMKAAAIGHMLGSTQCRGVVCADYALEEVEKACCSLAMSPWIAILDTDESVRASARHSQWHMAAILREPAGNPELRSANADAPMQLLFTSGTSGLPKAIVASHRRFTDTAAATPLFGFGPEDRPYTGLSLTHANAQLITLGAALFLGARAVISRRFTRSRLWEILRLHGCTVFNLLGGMTIEVFAMPPGEHDRNHSVRRVLSAGMPVELWQRFEQRYGVQVFEFYGQAEGVFTLNPPGVGPIGSVGKPPPNLEVGIFDEQGARCPAEVAGEICFRRRDDGPPQLVYLDNPAATAQRIRGSWLRTGDIGRLDRDGWLFFHHRDGDAIRLNGDLVSPRFIETIIAGCEDVRDVFVYGVPRANGAPGERAIVAAVVPREAGEDFAVRFFSYCAKNLERHLQPAFLQVVPGIPKTASEKPLERVLREEFLARSDNVHARPG